MHTPQPPAAHIDAARSTRCRQLPLADVVVTFTDLHDRLVRALHDCGFAFAVLLQERDALDGRIVGAVTCARDVLDAAIGEIQTTELALQQRLDYLSKG